MSSTLHFGTLHVGGCPPASETRIEWLALTRTGSQQRPAWMNHKRRHALVRPSYRVADCTPDQSPSETVVGPHAWHHSIAQLLPAGILPRQDGRVTFWAAHDSENFLGADRGKQATYFSSWGSWQGSARSTSQSHGLSTFIPGHRDVAEPPKVPERVSCFGTYLTGCCPRLQCGVPRFPQPVTSKVH